jgi:hypothetical protein
MLPQEKKQLDSIFRKTKYMKIIVEMLTSLKLEKFTKINYNIKRNYINFPSIKILLLLIHLFCAFDSMNSATVHK